MLVFQDGPAGRQNHRPMPRHQRLERRLIAGLGIASQELAVAETDGSALEKQVAEMP